MPYSPDGQMATQQDVMQSINQAFNPQQAAGQYAKGYQNALPAGQPGSTAGTDETSAPPSGSLTSYEQAAPQDETAKMHMINQQQRAQEAQEKYQQENGVDANGNPVQAAQ